MCPAGTFSEEPSARTCRQKRLQRWVGPQVGEAEDASAEAEEMRQERMGLTPDWLIDVRPRRAARACWHVCLAGRAVPDACAALARPARSPSGDRAGALRLWQPRLRLARRGRCQAGACAAHRCQSRGPWWPGVSRAARRDQAACFTVFQLPRPTPERPYVQGLLDPCTNSLAAPNIPAEVLYDKQVRFLVRIAFAASRPGRCGQQCEVV